MFFIYASLLEFVFVNYIGRKRPRRPSEFTGPPQPGGPVSTFYNLMMKHKFFISKQIRGIFNVPVWITCWFLRNFNANQSRTDKKNVYERKLHIYIYKTRSNWQLNGDNDFLNFIIYFSHKNSLIFTFFYHYVLKQNKT